MINFKKIKTIIFLISFPCFLIAGQTGKIVGKITDKKSGEPVIGANVLIRDTKIGAATDFEGDYLISNVMPGNYELIISGVGYKNSIIKNVIVKIDLTTSINVVLEETIIEGEEIVIVAERPLVQKDLTSSSVTVSSDEMKILPVENLSQVINLQAGVVGGHFRGGRSGEVAYLVDGISVVNPLSGNAGFVPEKSSVREMEIISGTFNAEYGQAMSGVVNIVTQDGSKDLLGSVGFYLGDYLTNHSDVFINLNKLNLDKVLNAQFTLSGPTNVIDNLSFFVTGRVLNEKGYLYGKRIFNVTDEVPTFPDPNDRTVFINHNTGDGSIVGMNPYHKNSLNGKLTYNYDEFKFSYNGFFENSNWKSYDHNYKWTPDGILNHFSENWMQNFQINHMISNATFQSLKFSVNKFSGKGFLYENPYDSRYVDPYRGSSISNYTFRSGGNQTWRYSNKSFSQIGLWTISSQINKEHKITSGVEVRLHELYNNSTNISVESSGNPDSVFKPKYPNAGTIGNQSYKKNPIEVSSYIQDKMEYGIMIINAGLRFDYFDPSSNILLDLKNPTRNSLFENAGKLVKTKEKIQVSPRLGVSFPITDEGIIHFSYGHFFQIPSFNNLYENSEYLISPTAQLQSLTGNPDLEAQRTVMYELGLQQQFGMNIGIDFSVYYRDIRNLLGTEIIQTHEGFKYARYVNRDYGNVRGFIFSIDKRFADYYSLRADYTYQIAEGNASDPLTVFFNNQSDPPLATNKKVVPLNWDQRSTLNISFNVGEQGNWMTGLIMNYGDGFPYTESIRVNGGLRFENGGKKPNSLNLDFRAEKNINLFGLNGNVFLLFYNLLDFKNELDVNSASGRANVDLFLDEAGPIYGLNSIQEYLNDPNSFSTPRNLRIGFNLDF
ncbi:MAG: TonB-dependent receptor [Ignavibacteria bacterium]|nr:TonB-dependent receptor [Bacteroidota bacterium]MSQ46256.1 TonB-dependent receptor [Ignavibacteria bacterium]